MNNNYVAKLADIAKHNKIAKILVLVITTIMVIIVITVRITLINYCEYNTDFGRSSNYIPRHEGGHGELPPLKTG